MATQTFYPSKDGIVLRYTADPGETWSAVRDATSGTGAGTSNSETYYCFLQASTTTNQWREIIRSFFMFDTSALGAGANITSATLSFYVTSVTDELGISLSLIESSPASNSTLVNDDYNNVTFTRVATDIASGSLTTGQYNSFTLNATGLAYINKTGYTDFALTFDHDVDNSPPTWGSAQASYIQGYFLPQGTIYRPKLEITYNSAYSMDCTVGTFSLTGKDITVSKTLNAIANVGQFVLTGKDILVNKALNMLTTVGQFTLTGFDLITSKALSALLSVGQFTLTGVDITVRKTLSLFANVGQFILTGKDILTSWTNKGWDYVTKHTSTWEEEEKNTSAWTEQSKNSTTWTPQDKN